MLNRAQEDVPLQLSPYNTCLAFCLVMNLPFAETPMGLRVTLQRAYYSDRNFTMHNDLLQF